MTSYTLNDRVERKIFFLTKKDFFFSLILMIYILNPFNLNVIVLPGLLISLLWILKGNYSKVFWFNIFILGMFSFTYGFINYMYKFTNLYSLINYILLPCSMYILGYLVMNFKKCNKKLLYYIFLVIITYSLFGFCNLIYTIIKFNGMENAILMLNGRYVMNIFDGTILKATLFTSMIGLGIGLITLVLFSKKNELPFFLKILCVVIFFGSIISSVIVGNRTGILLLILAIISVFLFSDGINGRKMWDVFKIMALGILIFISFSANVFGMKDSWNNSVLGSRFVEMKVAEDPRIQIWIDTFLGIFKYPMGGKEINIELSYAHNLWLDVGYETGMIPFMLSITFTISIIYQLFRLVKLNIPLYIKQLFIAIYTVIFAYFFLEPILLGVFNFFVIFCFISGLLQSYIDSNMTLYRRHLNYPLSK